MVRLFQAARLSVSMEKMWPQLAGGRKRNRRHIGAEITDKNVLYCRGAGAGAVSTGYDERIFLLCTQTHTCTRVSCV